MGKGLVTLVFYLVAPLGQSHHYSRVEGLPPNIQVNSSEDTLDNALATTIAANFRMPAVTLLTGGK